MKRIAAIMFIGVFFLLPATSSAGPPIKLEERVAQLETLVASLQTQLNAETTARVSGDAATLSSAVANAKVYTDSELLRLNSFVTGLENYVTVDTTNDRITFTGVNLHLVNGTGSTINGKGNLIIGYNLPVGYPPSVRTGSHNLVIGNFHSYSSSGGFVTGEKNSISNAGSTVCGGYNNIANGIFSSVSGGFSSTASGSSSNVSGGYSNTASGHYSSVSGGQLQNATTEYGYAP